MNALRTSEDREDRSKEYDCAQSHWVRFGEQRWVNFCERQGSYSLQRRVRLASDFSRWLEQNGVTVRDLSSLHPGQYLRHRARKVRIGRGDAPALRYLMAFLRRVEAIPADEEPPAATTPVECCVEEYEQYLREERALATATIVNYLPFIRELLTHRFGDTEVQLGELRAGDVVGFVQRRAHQLHIKRAKLMTTALRSFLQYARYRGDLTLALAAAIPPVANWSMTSIGRRARSACALRAGGASSYPYRTMSVRRSSPISSTDDPTAAAGAYFCATRRRCAVS